MARKFKIGDVVRLNSDNENATPMTVRYYVEDLPGKKGIKLIYPDSQVMCSWRNQNLEAKEAVYGESQLTLVDESNNSEQEQ